MRADRPVTATNGEDVETRARVSAERAPWKGIASPRFMRAAAR
ncbi:hypothetical protein K788_00042850 (plasmid) [Paraburkholderia caribensis MBA4]|uniref:Uncharacterized protein n=1 Tax=Paraburkholderia caribensis MBA4 TaxID=1323664 RepID=A0A0N7JVQ6_9BURK|nr:hypothetical protein K788_00042850 [Paraburkholderia caribensis MBA4]